VADNDPDVTRVLERIRFEYVPAALTAVPARRAVTELKRPLDVLTDAADRPDRPARTASLAAPQFLSAGEAAAGADAAERGTLTHRFLQWLDLRRTDGAAALGEQLTELIDAGRLPRSAERVVDVEAVAHFFSTELGHRLREQAAHVTREIMFVSRSRPDALDAAAAPIDDRDVVLIRGMIDAVLPAGDGLELIDYKTDTIAADQVVDRVERYRPQLETYAQAAAAVWRRPVTRCWLVFLTPRQVVSL
jgi:ATP-dependent helicase/nuclease subunit A